VKTDTRSLLTIRTTVMTVFVIATAFTAALAIGLQYYFGNKLARDAALDIYTNASFAIANQLRQTGENNRNVIELLADNRVLESASMTDELRAVLAEVLQQNPLFYGVYLGRSDGSFYQLINLAVSEKARRSLKAQPSDRWLTVSIEPLGDSGERRREFQYLDQGFNLRETRSEATDYDLTTRPWYLNALASSTIARSTPYLFAQLQVPGTTLSKQLAGTDTVLGIDMTLATISEFLRQRELSRGGDVYIYREQGQVVASSMEEPSRPGESSASTVPHEILKTIAADPGSQNRLIDVEYRGQAYFAYGAPLSGGRDSPDYFGILVPADSVVGDLIGKVKLSAIITVGFLLLLLPLTWLFASPIVKPVKLLAAENDKVRRREYDRVEPVTTRVRELDELSRSMVSMVTAIQAHELAQRNLMDSFIQLIAEAIDDKSAYTGGHCARVPELAMMLAEHACKSDQGSFKDFKLDTEDEWREYRIGAWLHDCGKITTPEHIVDKGTKLETIYNRIHEVRMRFEVLHRDAEIHYWQQLQQSPENEAALASELERAQKQLQDDFSFVAQCNVGGEYLDEEKQARLVELAKTCWQRYFDDRAGLSPVEELRLPASDDTLPATEYLLNDKREHIIEREHPTDFSADLGIQMDIPEHLYNMGEIYNLSVTRGTLTTEDRFKINEHMISTIKMLDALPFPQELKKVPTYASTHHEAMNGGGYPRRLGREDLGIPERIMAVADVFEALTASDRPYKKAKPISVAIDIMHKMALDNHLDMECFELFVREKVYLQYAERFLPAEQVDEVDSEKYGLA